MTAFGDYALPANSFVAPAMPALPAWENEDLTESVYTESVLFARSCK